MDCAAYDLHASSIAFARKPDGTCRFCHDYSGLNAITQRMAEPLVIYLDFSLDLAGFFSGKHLIQFLANKMQDFQIFSLRKCILIFDAEQVYLRIKLRLQITMFKNKEVVTANPKPQTLPARRRDARRALHHQAGPL